MFKAHCKYQVIIINIIIIIKVDKSPVLILLLLWYSFNQDDLHKPVRATTWRHRDPLQARADRVFYLDTKVDQGRPTQEDSTSAVYVLAKHKLFKWYWGTLVT